MGAAGFLIVFPFVFPVVGCSFLTNFALPSGCYDKIRPRFEGEKFILWEEVLCLICPM